MYQLIWICVYICPHKYTRRKNNYRRGTKKNAEVTIYIFVKSYGYAFIYAHTSTHAKTYYRVAKTHRIPSLYRSFSAKVTYI